LEQRHGVPGALSLRRAAALIPFEVVTDSEFETLGFLSEPAPRMLTFAEDHKYLREAVHGAHASAVLTTPDLVTTVTTRMGLAVTAHPRRDFFRLHNALAHQTSFYGEPVPSQIDESARIHPRATVAPQGVCIGPDVTIEANAVIGPGCTLGRGVVVRAGAVLGSSGFQTCRDESGYIEMKHTGSLLVEENVEIFSNATVALGLFHQTTHLGRETRIGNNAFVSHNVEIGSQSFIGHGAVVNGHVRIGREVWIGPGAVVTNSVSIGDGCRVSLGSVVVSNLAAGEHVSGNFAVPHRRLLRHVASIK
jgi:UDP-3-O-[3-hydroxymyristoyl] glucosamine N-acyltransferase